MMNQELEEVPQGKHDDSRDQILYTLEYNANKVTIITNQQDIYLYIDKEYKPIINQHIILKPKRLARDILKKINIRIYQDSNYEDKENIYTYQQAEPEIVNLLIREENLQRI